MANAGKPACSDALTWLRGHLAREGNRYALGALTGQDTKALTMFAHALQLYAVADRGGRTMALLAMHAARGAMQRSCVPFCKKLIPWALDWSDEARVWNEIDEVEADLFRMEQAEQREAVLEEIAAPEAHLR